MTQRTDEDPDASTAKERLPRHVAIIMDGNRRWARSHGVPEPQGHAAGVEAIRPIVEHATARGVEVLTIYAFSRENWQRSSHEVEVLIGLLEGTIRDETPRLIEEGVQVRLAGRLDELPPETRVSIEEAVLATASGERMVLNVAFNYSSRSEIVDAVHAYVDAGNDLARLDEKALGSCLYTAGLPDPDLLIRTGGDQRISNFLLWQAAYAELYFCDVYWPDFGPAELDAAIAEFASRARRFGR
ncbi:MAG: polyprenyl diphosphate synthase [Chloroflexota bacterium]|nr:polyprenyl diphosphate synthase [Chloroflexota bacterium]